MSQFERTLMQCNYDQNTRDYIGNECTILLSQYRSLAPKTVSITVHGNKYKCFCLEGTIPVPFKGNTYNIPVRFVYHNNYPSLAPRAQVVPTKEMFIKTSEYVNDSGVVTLDLLSRWQPSYNTFDLIDQMTQAFSVKMPVYNKVPKHQQPAAEEKKRTNEIQEKNIPAAFYCPISQEIMRDPVMTPSGHCFERREIEKWLQNNSRCPLTGGNLNSAQLIPCITLRQAISEFCNFD